MNEIPADVMARMKAKSGSAGAVSSDFLRDVLIGLGDMMAGQGSAYRPDSNIMRQKGMEQDYQKQMDARFQQDRQSGQRRPLQQEQMLQLLDQLSPSNPITRDEMYPLIGGR